MADLLETKATDSLEGELFNITRPDKTLSEVILSPENRFKVKQLILEIKNWILLDRSYYYPKKKVLFFGPPGCGKTSTAKALASELAVPLMQVRYDAIVSACLAESSSMSIKRMLDFAKESRYVILFDEFDAIARSRGDLRENAEVKEVVNSLLQQIDTFRGHSVIVAATNCEQCLDSAMWRRFDGIFRFDMPNETERKQLFELRMLNFYGESGLINEFLPQMNEFSHADVEKVALGVIKACILEGRIVYTKEDVEKAFYCQKELVSLRKTRYSRRINISEYFREPQSALDC
ncbi:MAG: ATP-binding protein [Clostridiales bacterium]|nr:ATP-binding protein [Clostridiales bacterium]